MKRWMGNLKSWCWDAISSRIFLSSTILGAALFVMTILVPLREMEIVPHIITYASCNLALVGFVFSILFGVKGAEMYNRIERLFPCKLKDFYRLVFRTTVSSSLTVFISILVIAIPKWEGLPKYMITYACIVTFLYMVIGTYFSLDFLITLMIKDIKKPEDKGIV